MSEHDQYPKNLDDCRRIAGCRGRHRLRDAAACGPPRDRGGRHRRFRSAGRHRGGRRRRPHRARRDRTARARRSPFRACARPRAATRGRAAAR
ncbi:hypothetical protein F7R21_32130, partial [Burkholderia latens]